MGDVLKVYTEERTELDRYCALAKQTQTGWWELNVSTKEYRCSDYISQVMGLNTGRFTLTDIVSLVRSDYRDLLKNKLFELSPHHLGFKETHIPLITPKGQVWVKTRICEHFIEKSEEKLFGTITVVSADEQEKTSVHDSHFMVEVNAVSASMLALLRGESEGATIHELFKNILNFYQVSDIFISEFSKDNKFQSFTHEVTAEEDSSMMNKYRFLANSNVPWLTQQLLLNRPVVVDQIEQLPAEAKDDLDFFNKLNVKSFIAIPLFNGKRVWGFLGIDKKEEK